MKRIGVSAVAITLGLAIAPAIAAEWNPKAAAAFLDERQKQWFEWKIAARTGGPCVSCHTGLPYLIARPALRRVLGETAPTQWETGYLDALRARSGSTDAKAMLGFGKEPVASQSMGVEAIFAALFLRDSVPARERLRNLQLREGNERGAWNWFQVQLEPWEETGAPFFGAALAAMALDHAPPADREQTAALTAYLKRAAGDQPLQNRLELLWTARKLPGMAKREWIDEAFAKQSADGGWTNEALGPWKEHKTAAPSPGSNAYATAFATFALLEAGVKASDPRMVRALDWLRSHQNERGYWDAVSMNKVYEAGSMQEQFMRDAATGFAAAALIKAQY
jgi:squalene-hopene/tetraprenyl-beta-curcumene cyclase